MISDIQEIIADVRQGRMVIMVDDANRENEGDLVVAATQVTPEIVNFMASQGRGLICLTLTRAHCQKLNLPLMVSGTDLHHGTNFTVSIEAREGVSTGISAQDRAHTIKTAVAPNASPRDVTRPGHVFPLMAQDGGVLSRAGHTEAGCDLARLAKLDPSAVIVEILNNDGTMARMDDLEKFATQHQLKIGTIESLIKHRVSHEKTVSCISRTEIETAAGRFLLHSYQDRLNETTHLALTLGEICPERPVLVRVHIENTLRDTLQIIEKNHYWNMEETMKRIVEAGEGAIVILRLPEKYQSLQQEIEELLSGRARSASKTGTHRWTVGVGGQILSDLGVGQMIVAGSPQHFHGLGGFGLSIKRFLEK